MFFDWIWFCLVITNRWNGTPCNCHQLRSISSFSAILLSVSFSAGLTLTASYQVFTPSERVRTKSVVMTLGDLVPGTMGWSTPKVLAIFTDRSRGKRGNCSLISMTESQDRKSTRLNSSHVAISYAVFCLKKKNERSNV